MSSLLLWLLRALCVFVHLFDCLLAPQCDCVFVNLVVWLVGVCLFRRVFASLVVRLCVWFFICLVCLCVGSLVCLSVCLRVRLFPWLYAKLF